MDSQLFTVSPGSDDGLLISYRIKKFCTRWVVTQSTIFEQRKATLTHSLNPGMPQWHRRPQRKAMQLRIALIFRGQCDGSRCPICKINILTSKHILSIHQRLTYTVVDPTIQTFIAKVLSKPDLPSYFTLLKKTVTPLRSKYILTFFGELFLPGSKLHCLLQIDGHQKGKSFKHPLSRFFCQARFLGISDVRCSFYGSIR